MAWRPQCSVFQVVKAGNEPDQCDDAAEFRLPVSTAPLRAAVADGATEAMLSGLWARCLVRAASRTPLSLSTHVMLERARGYWQSERTAYLAERERNDPLKWYEETGLARGSMAALCWVEFQASRFSRKGTYAAAGVGDVCLFHTRRGGLLDSFPLGVGAKFGNRPALLATDKAAAPPAFETKSGSWRSGDILLLASDALADWLLAHAADRAVWAMITGMRSDSSFSKFVAATRDGGDLRNDDVTMLLIRP